MILGDGLKMRGLLHHLAMQWSNNVHFGANGFAPEKPLERKKLTHN
jgi:hypothetical protein